MTYNFICSECGCKQEFQVSMNTTEMNCPECKTEKSMKRQFSPPTSYSIVKGGYDELYGSRAWRSRTSPEKHAEMLNNPNMNPY